MPIECATILSTVGPPLCHLYHKSVQISEVHSLIYKVVIKYFNRTHTTLIEHTLGVKYSNRAVSRTVRIIEVLLYL